MEKGLGRGGGCRGSDVWGRRGGGPAMCFLVLVAQQAARRASAKEARKREQWGRWDIQHLDLGAGHTDGYSLLYVTL